MLPGDPGFNEILATPPPSWRQVASNLSGEFAFIVRANTGLLEPVSYDDLDEYIEGGEYDERLEVIDDDDLEYDLEEEEELLLYC